MGLALRKSILNSFVMVLAFVVVGSIFSVATCLGQTMLPPTPKQQENLREFLQRYLRDPIIGDDKTTQYFPAFVDLKGDGTLEVIVYITGPHSCGSGGCNTLILAPKNSSYRLVTSITITRPPIRVLNTKSNGWHDITVQVQGGGIIRAYEAELSFDGKTYPRNPSVPPARRLSEKVAGEEVVPLTALTERATPLY
jgi:hypothetical protein